MREDVHGEGPTPTDGERAEEGAGTGPDDLAAGRSVLGAKGRHHVPAYLMRGAMGGCSDERPAPVLLVVRQGRCGEATRRVQVGTSKTDICELDPTQVGARRTKSSEVQRAGVQHMAGEQVGQQRGSGKQGWPAGRGRQVTKCAGVGPLFLLRIRAQAM